MMGMWKWNLAFQCVVNIGVRGTENVRTRVVEADMVPVIATILDNYIKVIDRCREKADEMKQKQILDHSQRHKIKESRDAKASASFANRPARSESEHRAFRRQGPPPSIDVSAASAGPSSITQHNNAEASSSSHPISTPQRQRHATRASESRVPSQHLSSAGSAMDTVDGMVRPVREVERLASMAALGSTDLFSQPTSPTTPLPPPQLRSPTVRLTTAAENNARERRRPSIRHQHSMAENEETNADSLPSDDAGDTEMTETGDIRSAVGIQDITMEDGEGILPDESIDLTAPTVSETHQDPGTFNISHPSPINGSIGNTTTTAPVPPIGLSPNRPTMPTPQPAVPNATIPRYLLDRHFMPNQQMLAVMPREEDVLMSLQLLAYVSKYCGLRSYFQSSHIVPKLTIGSDLSAFDGEEPSKDEEEEARAVDEEYLMPNDFNLFPLVEKFTVRHHNTDMQYWAGVVMRNLCRKDDTRGGIRQCAYYQCGKWEEYTRQFAKCRRCRRTKYCSKECQKSAWAFHRHWCVAASQ